MAKFFLRTQKSEGDATLYITVQKRIPKVSLRFVATGISVDIQTWNKANKSIQAWNRFAATEEGAELTRKMQLVTQTIDRLFADGRIGGNEDKDVIENALYAISYAEAIKMEQEIERIKEEQRERDGRSIIGFYNYFLDGITDGSIRHGDGKKYTEGTITVWRSFGRFLLEYCPATMTFDQVSKPFADKFSVYLEQKGLMPSSINKQVICFRKLCNLAAEEGLNSNAVSLKVWKERTVKSSEKRAEVYLTEDELDALYQMPLKGEQERVRDLFFIGYVSSQRFSDYSDFTMQNFKKTSDGTDVIGLTQKKTGNYVEVPVWDRRLFEIAEKYGYVFPRMEGRKLNREIKAILKALSVTVPSLREKFPTVLQLTERRSEALYKTLCDKQVKGIKMTVTERNEYQKLKRYAEEHNGNPLFERDRTGQVIRPKYELVSSHTARRSSITNLYKLGVLNNREIMSISGHQSEKVFESYIKVGVSEQAQRVGEKLRKAKTIPLKKNA